MASGATPPQIGASLDSFRLPFVRRTTLLLTLFAAAAAVVAAWLFPKAFPIVAIEGRISRASALERADSVLLVHDLAPGRARRAVRFSADDSLRTFVELGGGGKDTLDALLRSRSVALFSWNVRAFDPGEVKEARVRLSADGRLLGFRRVLPDSLFRPALDSVAANGLAREVIDGWLRDGDAVWRLRSSSVVTQPGSGRIDRTFTFERPDRSIAGAAIRLDVVIAGDLPAEARPYVDIPESFSRRYDEMRSANDLLALAATIGIMVLAVAAVIALRRYARDRVLRWRWPVVIGTVIGGLTTAALLNDVSASWFLYNTADSAVVHQFVFYVAAIAAGGGTALMVTLTLAAAEVLTRHAFPWHADWWQLWRYRGSREVAGAVFGGYAMAAIGFAYIATFYLVTRNLLGWWVPSELIDDPNQIATPFPWIAGIAMSLQAAVWEESLFRAIPLSLITLWARHRENPERWIALGVVATALVFGFAHSNYASWPPYSRGVEIFLEACLWAVLFLRFGLLLPIIAHFVFDLVLFSLFATGGSAPQYRLTAGIMLTVLLAPALAVAWARLRQGAWAPVPDEGRFQAWRPPPVLEKPPAVAGPARATIVPRSRQVALALGALALAGTVLRPSPRTAGPAFTASRLEVLAVADSVLRSQGVDPGAWTRLVSVPLDTALASRARFFERQHAESLAVSLSADYAIPRWWLVRYVRTEAPVAERAEEWRVRVLPDGSPLGVRHLVPREAAGAMLSTDSARALARGALVAGGLDPGRFVETDVREDPHDNRLDYTFTFTDMTVTLPADAAARAKVSVAGDEVLSVVRSVELPESFERDMRGEMMRNVAVAGSLGILALGLGLWGVVRLSRRTPLLHDGFPKSLRLGLLGLLAIVMLAQSLLEWNSMLAGWDTATPWDQFLGTTVAMQAMMVVMVLLLAGLWMVANGLRRRAGIPVLADPPGRPGLPDEVVIGVGLGALLPLISLGWALLRPEGVPGPPSTSLDSLVPLLSGVPGVVLDIAATVPLAAIAGLAPLGMASGTRGRIFGATCLLALFGAALLAADPGPARVDPRALAWGVVGIAATIAGVRAWGGLSAVTWVYAVLFSGVLGDLRATMRATTGVERASGLVSLTVALTLVWVVHRWSQRQRRAAPDDPGPATSAMGPPTANA